MQQRSTAPVTDSDFYNSFRKRAQDIRTHHQQLINKSLNQSSRLEKNDSTRELASRLRQQQLSSINIKRGPSPVEAIEERRDRFYTKVSQRLMQNKCEYGIHKNRVMPESPL